MKVLIVDDSVDSLAAARARLASEGVTVLCADGGCAGLAAAGRERPDLILLDLDMPDMSGFDVIRQLKADAVLANIPVIFLSASDDSEDKIAGWDLGGADYVTKPFDGFELRARVRAALRAAAAEEALRQSSQFNQEVISEAQEGIVVYDQALKCVVWNRFMAELTGVDDKQALGAAAEDSPLLSPEQDIAALLRRALGGETIRNADMPFQVPSTGRAGWVSVTCSPHRAADGQVLGVIAMVRDITERKRAEEENRNTLSLLAATLESTADGILVVDRAGKVTTCNQRFAEMWRIPRAGLVAGADDPVLAGVTAQAKDPVAFLAMVQQLYAQPDAESHDLLELKDGRVFDGFSTPQRIGSAVVGRVWCFRDVTDRKVAEQQLRDSALHDALTGLPNRALLTEHLTAAIDKARRQRGYRFAVMFLDCDRFKVINDSLGHGAGDQLLIEVSRRLRESLRAQDVLCPAGHSHVARLGGDEFVIFLDSIRDVSDAANVAERLQQLMRKPLQINGQQVNVTASIGIVVSDGTYQSPDEIVRDADTAMYRAKTEGRARYVVFDRHMHDQAMLRLQLEGELRRAVENGEFRLHYQPIVCLETGAVARMEALVRWDHPQRGIVGPAEFIPAAEETGLIVPIGYCVLRAACKHLQEMRRRLASTRPPAISVNLSKRQLMEPDLLEQLERLLQETGVDPDLLELEVTETVIMENAETVAPILAQIRELGITLSMDDFGTGHSSLSCLHEFPISVLKIDRSFIRNMGLSLQHSAIAHAIVTLAHNLGMSVVAEGIESLDQLVQLQAMGCDFGQGYFFSRPVAAEQAIALAAVKKWLRKSA